MKMWRTDFRKSSYTWYFNNNAGQITPIFYWKRHNSTLRWPLSTINSSLDAKVRIKYFELQWRPWVLNSEEIVGLIIYWKEVRRLFDFDKIILSDTCIKTGRFLLPFLTKLEKKTVIIMPMCIPNPINIESKY